MPTPRSIDSQTVSAHKRQLAWQILIPFLVVTMLIVAAAVLVVAGTASTTRIWADVSTIWLIAPMLVFALFFATLLGFLIYAIAKLQQVTPRYTGKVQGYFRLISGWTRQIADGAAKPFVWVQQAGAIFKSIFKQ
jgi:hypothetical protein